VCAGGGVGQTCESRPSSSSTTLDSQHPPTAYPMSDDFVLVAPRPRRVSSLTASRRAFGGSTVRIMSPPAENPARIRLSDDEQTSDEDNASNSGRNTASPRHSLPADALEEFLSILRPSMLSSASPTYRQSRLASGLLPSLTYDRSPVFKQRDLPHSKTASLGSITGEEGEAWIKNKCPSPVFSGFDAFSFADGEQDPKVWHIPGILDSPISRTLTRNPFQRHPSYEISLANALAAHLSPALIPLPASPSPTPLILPPSEAAHLAEMEEKL